MSAVSREMYRKGQSDGLPVIPPTKERVEEMLRGTDLSRRHEFGTVGNRDGVLTVETVAINGVMAGCLPLHMPILVAGARIMADPDSGILRIAVSTGSWGYLWVVNGPIREKTGIESSFRVGSTSNRVIGRALGLTYKNTALVHPGEKNMGVQGNPSQYSLVVGEHEEASPWDPLHVTEEYSAGESTLTFGGPNTFAQYSNRPEEGAYGQLKDLLYNTPSRLDRSDRTSRGVWAIHMISPASASVLADAGLTKREVKAYQFRNADRIQATHSNFTYGPDDDGDTLPELRTPHGQDPSRIKIMVIGEGNRENVVVGPALAGTTTQKISLPANWDDLRRQYASHPLISSLQ